MKKTVFIMVIALCTAALAAQAGVTIGKEGGPNATASFVLTVTDLNATPPVLSGVEIDPIISGSFSAAGDIPSDASFRLTLTGATGWEASAAKAALLNGTFLSYIDNLNPSVVTRSTKGTFGVLSDHVDRGRLDALSAGDVLFVKISLNGFRDQSLMLEQLFFDRYTEEKCLTDLLIYDVSENDINAFFWNKSFSGGTVDADADTNAWVLEDGDIIVVAVSHLQGSFYRFKTMTFDVVSKLAAAAKKAPVKELAKVTAADPTVSSDVSETATKPKNDASIPLALLGVVIAVSGVSLLVYRLKNR